MINCAIKPPRLHELPSATILPLLDALQTDVMPLRVIVFAPPMGLISTRPTGSFAGVKSRSQYGFAFPLDGAFPAGRAARGAGREACRFFTATSR